jgi:hypothetical protein
VTDNVADGVLRADLRPGEWRAGDAHFLLNNSEEPLERTFYLRATGKAEVWDPATGEMRSAVAKSTGGVSAIRLRLPRGNGLLVVFSR